ncbi:MAG: tetratricopeptide repeat protein [Phormidesmis sp.]
MRSLKSVGAHLNGAVNHSANVSAQPGVAASTLKAPPATTRKPNRLYRFQPNSCLSQADTHFLLKKQASWQAQKKDYPAAIRLLDHLIASEPDNAEYYSNRGLMYYHTQQWKRALADYNQAIAIDPELDSAYNNRANLYASEQNWTEAIADYDQAIDFNPLNIRARLNQAITFREMGIYPEALICLEIAIVLNPDAALYAERGRVYHLQGDWNCAIADYRTALRLTQQSQQKSLSNPSALNRRISNWMNSLC